MHMSFSIKSFTTLYISPPIISSLMFFIYVSCIIFSNNLVFMEEIGLIMSSNSGLTSIVDSVMTLNHKP
jgi:hypothetical protein